MVSKSADPLTGDRGFESCSLQRRVTCEPDFLSLAARCALRVSDAARAGAGQLAAPPPAAIRGERPRRARPHNPC